ncbi:hypothetical protein [Pseudomonas sp. Marseille-Q1929]|uniref:hypothetical protein n=1 Tax=Pseudomonas sp. Marseille-Q1929 TaxID=2730402 RepID=UPI001A8D089E|nr:hypothetical protein [Pseudomonas sp. Marseille-Q1929]MBO0496860.1 hypothetical protein [Pseudomonas sp. Marseille-Q1929]
MQSIQSNPSAFNPTTLQSTHQATQAGAFRKDGLNPDIEFTVKNEHYSKAQQILNDTARSKGMNIQYSSGVHERKDLGEGNISYFTSNFTVLPDRPDGSYSPELQKKIGELRQEVQTKLHEAGITNHGYRTEASPPLSGPAPDPMLFSTILVPSSKADQAKDIALNIARVLGLPPPELNMFESFTDPHLDPPKGNLTEIQFRYPPDRPDGTVSAELEQKLYRFNNRLQHVLREEGIRVYG